MSVTAVLLPLFLQVALTLGLAVWLGRIRFRAVALGQVRAGDIVLGQRAWPDRAQQVSNAFDNQFQLPLLFYVLTALALVTRKADLVFVVLAWLFVASRFVHAAIHTGSNHLLNRFRAFLLGFVVLCFMWIAFAIQILVGL